MSGLDPTLLVAGDFVLLRMALVDDLDGDYEAAILLQRIAWRCERDGHWQASHADLQAETRLSERKVKRAVATLRQRGYLESGRASSWDPTQVWRVVLDRPSGDGRNVRHDADVPAVTVPDVSSVTSSQHPETTTNTTHIVDDLALAFDEFWALYPRKVGKGAARTAYAKARRKAEHRAITDAVMAYAEHHRARRTEPQFIANAATWLNQERWDDVLPDVTARERAAADAEVRSVEDRQAFGNHWAAGGGW